MTEVRMRQRAKGQQFPTSDLEAYLVAFGDERNPLPETVKCLDEIITDYIIEGCHEAAAVASYSRRSKIKVEDFKHALRRDPPKLGRVSELLALDKEIKKKRKAFETDEAVMGKEGAAGEKDEDPEDGKDDGKKTKKKKTKKDKE
ncbi:TFIID-18kDa-domain-containing protein [Patellaria atrata CBS 101060]|uniref:Transcription initiation factor TFIID subunit 13 n=1 Tax=Patellaria atrata CBS 101060 TaxID=1346257 RepID=A0A9P4SF77_9PEZI|nr:TFIID-18kDa-domain-containing protein [Patellaria atrata CBS 101060]